MEEIWKPIKDYEGLYEVSNLGRVKSLERVVVRSNQIVMKVEERFLIPYPNKDGYLLVKLYMIGRGKTYLVHRLVANAFIPNLGNKETINHINGIKTDNTLKNLEWATRSENTKHAYETGLKMPIQINGEDHGASKLTEEIVNNIRNNLDILTQREIGEKYGVSQSLISRIKAGKRWKHI